MNAAGTQQTIIVPHEQVTLDLLERIENHTNEDEQRCAAKELCELGLHIEQSCEGRHTGNCCQEQRTGQGDMVHDPVNEFSCLLTRTNARDETVVALHILCHLNRIKSNGSIEICERNNQPLERAKG